MLFVKICGITSLADALAAVNAGADGLGFVFAEKSKRRADPATLGRIGEKLPPSVKLFGVFQNQPPEYVNGVMRECGLNVAQLHGGEDAEYFGEIDFPVLKAFGVKSREDLRQIERFALPEFLLDSGSGGSGEVFDWNLALEAKKYGKVILAGGLTPENVGEAVRKVRPFGVDTAGGVEKSPGVKDHLKVAEFISAAKGAI